MLKGFIILLGISITTMMYLVIVGASKCKTQEERDMEDKEQMEYLKNWREKHEGK